MKLIISLLGIIFMLSGCDSINVDDCKRLGYNGVIVVNSTVYGCSNGESTPNGRAFKSNNGEWIKTFSNGTHTFYLTF